MGVRRDARRIAVKILYIADVIEVQSDVAWDMIGRNSASKKAIEFADKLIEGTLINIKKLDEIILKYTKNWDIERIAIVDKTILRLGIYEIFYEDTIPKNVSINEAIELAKYYSTSKSHKFVNGILDACAKDLEMDKN